MFSSYRSAFNASMTDLSRNSLTHSPGLVNNLIPRQSNQLYSRLFSAGSQSNESPLHVLDASVSGYESSRNPAKGLSGAAAGGLGSSFSAGSSHPHSMSSDWVDLTALPLFQACINSIYTFLCS